MMNFEMCPPGTMALAVKQDEDIKRLQAERDEWARTAEGFAAVADKARDERDALAAHVEELETLLHGALLGLRWFRDEHPDEDTETDAEFDTQVSVALQSAPATSLARLITEHVDAALGHVESALEAGASLDEALSSARRQTEGDEP